MRDDPRDYLSRAEHCRRMAEKSSYAEVRLQWLQLAAAWMALSDRDSAGDEEPRRQAAMSRR
jgi:hypothetical protein